MFNADPSHQMLQRALKDDVWDVMMVGLNMINQCAGKYVFPEAKKKNVGIVIMFAVRLALSRQERLNEVMTDLVQKGQVNPDDFNADDPLGFLVHDGGAISVPDAAYRFCHHDPGTDVILSGTGNPDHLATNLESFSRPPLPEDDMKKLKNLFKDVDSVTGQ